MALRDHSHDTTGQLSGAGDGNQQNVIIELPHGIAVRTYRNSDIASIARHANNKKVWDNVRDRMPHPYSIEDAQFWITHSSDPSHFVRSGRYADETGSQGPPLATAYAITINDEAIGSIGLEFGQDVYRRTAELGYWLGQEHWGKGVMSAVAPAFVEWTWRTFEILVRLNAEVFESNVGSRTVLTKAGFKVEGRKQDAIVKNGVIGSVVVYGALRPSPV